MASTPEADGETRRFSKLLKGNDDYPIVSATLSIVVVRLVYLRSFNRCTFAYFTSTDDSDTDGEDGG